MASKEAVCYKILKKYGFLIDGPEEVLTQLDIKSLPKRKNKETFNQWKMRVFSGKVDIEVYSRTIPDPRTKTSTLSEFSGEEHLQSIFEKYGKFKDRQLKEKVKSTEEEVTKRLTSFSKDTLEMLLEDLEDGLQEPAVEFMKKYISRTEDNINAEEMLKDLLLKFNEIVVNFRKATSQKQPNQC